MKRRCQVIIVAALAALMSSAVHARPGHLANEVTENTRAAIWDAMDARKPTPPPIPVSIQERAYTSPIWYPVVARFDL